MRVVLLIEPARGLDFLLFFSCRHIEAERSLDDFLLLWCEINKINPNHLLVNARLAFLWDKRS